ncbi:MAG: hypothetical protein WBA28_04760 [Microbacteriaceae bacterium]
MTIGLFENLADTTPKKTINRSTFLYANQIVTLSVGAIPDDPTYAKILKTECRG